MFLPPIGSLWSVAFAVTMKKVLICVPTSNRVLKRFADNNVAVEFLKKPQAEDDDGVDVRWLEQHGDSVDYVLTNGQIGFPVEYLDFLPNLKLMGSNGVGYDGIDTAEIVSKRRILVSHTPNVVDAETSTTAILLYLACYRNFRSCENHARTGAWGVGSPHPLTHTADQRTVGILGLGRIGTAIAEKLLPFGCNIVYHSRKPKSNVPYTYYSDLVQMAREVDCLVCVVPGGAATQHLVDDAVLDALGPDGVLINVSRGTVVDERALIRALQEKRLGWAGLDVFENEPDIPADLQLLENTVLLPHVGTATVETRANMENLVADNILQHVKDSTVLTAIPECNELLRVES